MSEWLDLSDEELAEATPGELRLLLRAVASELDPWSFIPHVPHAKQEIFLALHEQEALYGGAAGGGKSDALCMAAIVHCTTWPNVSAIMFRKTKADLKRAESLQDRLDAWLRGTAAMWVAGDNSWYFPNGSRLELAGLDKPTDKYKYQGAEFQMCAFDELTQFRESDYRYLFSRLRRTTDCEAPLFMRAGSNPGGVGHSWVKRRFVTSRAAGRVFIPARLEDNPSLDRVEYEKALAELSAVERRQLRHGDWDVVQSGGMFEEAWFYITSRMPEESSLSHRVRFWDFAASESESADWTVGTLMARDAAGRYWVLDVVRRRVTPGKADDLVRRTAEADGHEVYVQVEQEPGSSGLIAVRHFQGVLEGFATRGVPSTGSKEERARPFASAAEQGKVNVLEAPWNAEWLEEVVAFPEVDHDDQVDSSSGAFNALQRLRIPAVAPVSMPQVNPWEIG